MQSVTILCVGKIKETYFTDAMEEYGKRMKRYSKFRIQEVKDEPTPERPSPREQELVLEREGDRLLKKIPDNAFVVALCVEGKKMTSSGLAELFSQLGTEGRSHIVFVIGGSMGLDDRVKRRADLRLSFSDMTFPHQLMRVILAEQIYRAYTISAGGKYHK